MSPTDGSSFVELGVERCDAGIFAGSGDAPVRKAVRLCRLVGNVTVCGTRVSHVRLDLKLVGGRERRSGPHFLRGSGWALRAGRALLPTKSLSSFLGLFLRGSVRFRLVGSFSLRLRDFGLDLVDLRLLLGELFVDNPVGGLSNLNPVESALESELLVTLSELVVVIKETRDGTSDGNRYHRRGEEEDEETREVHG